ncbi:F-box domain containing protein [Pandoravirus salinus]|uniref:F-box domain containing protein n=1 Tax=Pandoravirus salinus TaxID=1349410 RepID=S4VYH7_9VIRU|nr:F-box domain [Pandoravirus salinus]AGO85754.1 F-box domain containing protein [Pandoravirus salinus]
MANSPPTLCDLPAEIQTAILAACRPTDAEALGATCCMMRALARDPLLWRRFFEGGFGHLYPTRTVGTRWPLDGVLGDAWVDSVCRGWGVEPPRINLPDVGKAWIPRPFAHMQSAGKDARWLYVFHARQAYIADLNVPSSRSRKPAEQYKVAFKRFPTSWTETATGRGGLSWNICADDTFAECWSATEDREEVHFRLDLASGQIRWWVEKHQCTMMSFVIEGPRTTPRRSAVDRQGRIRIDETIHRIYEHSDGSVTRSVQTQSDCDHHAETRYSNGDRVVYRLSPSGRVSDVTEFVCSPMCPEPEFAGRFIRPGAWQWRKCKLEPGDSEHYFWPCGECKDARLFRDYVWRGLIGWHPLVRETAIARADGV